MECSVNCTIKHEEECTIKHEIEECQNFERIEVNIEDIMKDQSDQEVKKLLRKEKNKEKVQKKRGEIM